jgi:hypothetical protein
MMKMTSNGQIKRRTALAKRKAMPMAPSLIARHTMQRHTIVLIAVVHITKRYSLSFRELGISLSEPFFNVIPILYQISG